MVGIKEAVSAANQFINEVYSTTFPDLMLEEIARSEDDKYWLVTLGFTREATYRNALQAALGNASKERERVYKTIKVDVETGQPIAMQMRKI